ncbi:MAG TPA: hypothetical protein VMR28_01185 [Candidatus Saccharimonadales bacterium]|nr:hypothetical protein [Candidatus Saccharimonadales bacterium]
MNSPEFTIQVATDANDSVIGIQRPVDESFREKMYDNLVELGLMKKFVLLNGTFFKTTTSADGSAYSEFRYPTDDLSEDLKNADKSLIKLAHDCAEVLEDQQHTTYVDPFMKSSRDHQTLFSNDSSSRYVS